MTILENLEYEGAKKNRKIQKLKISCPFMFMILLHSLIKINILYNIVMIFLA